ncbi:MAG: FMN-binding protein [Gammaproteobacteria bacterium]|nr:MAG: FMN-binding protein [Gammaproteobacteria bacterium]
MRCALILLMLCAAVASHADVAVVTQRFLTSESAAEPQQWWLDASDREAATAILGHAPGYMRLRYWPVEGGTAWVMDEIGKEMPITMGVVIRHGAIDRVQILEYRESRGGEVRYPFFTGQFQGARLQERQLDRHIDGISGATLSVRAVRNVARLALYLDARVHEKHVAGISQ